MQLFDKLWAHSLACAYVAIAKHLDMDDSEMLFQVGLVHDIGQLSSSRPCRTGCRLRRISTWMR